MWNKIRAKSVKPDLRSVILLYSQYTIDLLCNINLVVNIYKANKKVLLHSNRFKIIIARKAQACGYQPHVGLDQKAITNLIAVNNLSKQYYVTYDSLDEMLIFHLEEHGNHNMHFRMHQSSLYYYDPEDEDFFLST